MGKDGKPAGRTSSYAFFVKVSREENPDKTVAFAEFSKQCSERWKAMSPAQKKRFEDMAEKDKVRYDREMAHYSPPAGGSGAGQKRKKDPNAPKRPLSAFFCFSGEEREKVRRDHPDWSVGDIAKVLGERWAACTDRSKYEAMASKDKQRYEKELAAYHGKKAR